MPDTQEVWLQSKSLSEIVVSRTPLAGESVRSITVECDPGDSPGLIAVELQIDGKQAPRNPMALTQRLYEYVALSHFLGCDERALCFSSCIPVTSRHLDAAPRAEYDRLCKAVGELFGTRWEAVQRAALHGRVSELFFYTETEEYPRGLAHATQDPIEEREFISGYADEGTEWETASVETEWGFRTELDQDEDEPIVVDITQSPTQQLESLWATLCFHFESQYDLLFLLSRFGAVRRELRLPPFDAWIPVRADELDDMAECSSCPADLDHCETMADELCAMVALACGPVAYKRQKAAFADVFSASAGDDISADTASPERRP